MLDASSEATERRRARLAEHRKLAPRVPPKRTNAFRRAADWLAPWREAYPGYRAFLSQLTGSSVASLRHWLKGSRAMPGDVRLRLIEAIETRLELGSAILAELKNYTPPSKAPPGYQREAARRNETSAKLDKP